MSGNQPSTGVPAVDVPAHLARGAGEDNSRARAAAMDVEQEQTRRVHAEVIKLLSDPLQCAASHFEVSRDLLSMIAQRLACRMVQDGGAVDGDPDLAELLADVHRIADGVDKIHDLCVMVGTRYTPPASVLGYGWRCPRCMREMGEGQQTGVYWNQKAVCHECAVAVNEMRRFDSAVRG